MNDLPSWRDGPTRAAILRFADAAAAVPEPQRIAVFDNDGTLWTEKPMPTQLHYIVQQWAAAAKADPALAELQPYKAAVTNDLAWLGTAIDKHYAGDDSDVAVLIGAITKATDGTSVDDYEASVAEFYRVAQHLTLHRPYSGAIYQPMIELLRFLESKGFMCYIVSGGDRDFMRPMTDDYYRIPPERVIGSALGLTYADGEVRYSAAFDFLNDGAEKPVRIWSRIGRRPLLAVGNSNGDVPMLEYARAHPLGMGILIHHDDDTGRGDAPYDKGAEDALAAGFTRVSVKDDWATVFPE
jgi:phosphoserine phosphatase